MKKKRWYRCGDVFEFGDAVYLLTQTELNRVKLVSLRKDSNRWCDRAHKKYYGRGLGEISDSSIRRMIGIDHDTDQMKKYTYLGQFHEVFEQIGR